MYSLFILKSNDGKGRRTFNFFKSKNLLKVSNSNP